MQELAQEEQTAAERALAQRRNSLIHANEIRVKRAALRHALKAGTASPAEVVRNVPDCMARVGLRRFLAMLPGVGNERALRFALTLTQAVNLKLGTLPPRVQRDLLRLLEERFEDAA